MKQQNSTVLQPYYIFYVNYNGCSMIVKEQSFPLSTAEKYSLISTRSRFGSFGTRVREPYFLIFDRAIKIVALQFNEQFGKIIDKNPWRKP